MDPLDPALAPAPPTTDATLPRADWQTVFALQRHGVSDAGMLRLLHLPGASRCHPGTTDGADGRTGPAALERDARARCARWLVATRRLHEGV